MTFMISEAIDPLSQQISQSSLLLNWWC